MIAQAKPQPRRRAGKIAIHAVALLLHRAVAGLELVNHPEPPLLVQAIIEATEQQVVAPAPVGVNLLPEKRVVRVTLAQLVRRQISEIAVAERPAPAIVGQQRDRVVGLVEQAVVRVESHLGTEQQPRARLEFQVGVNVVEARLALVRLQTPIGEQFPVQQVVDLAVALGLQAVPDAQAHDIARVDVVDRVVVREVDRSQAQRLQFAVELR